MALGFAGEVLVVEEQVAEASRDDRTGHRPDRDEQQVVEPEGAAPGDQARDDERRRDRGREREGLPAHDKALGQAEQGVEVERDDGDRHGAEQCI